MIVEDLRPIKFAEGDGFQNLMAFIAPGYKIRGRTFYTIKLKQIELKVLNRLRECLSTVETVALTTNNWTSSRMDVYMSVTVHYVSPDWEFCHYLLATLPLTDRHTNDNIKEWLHYVLANFNIPPCKVVAIVQDNASNVVSAADSLQNEQSAKSAHHNGWVSVRCAVHTLQLCIGQALAISTVARVLGACRAIVCALLPAAGRCTFVPLFCVYAPCLPICHYQDLDCRMRFCSVHHMVLIIFAGFVDFPRFLLQFCRHFTVVVRCCSHPLLMAPPIVIDGLLPRLHPIPYSRPRPSSPHDDIIWACRPRQPQPCSPAVRNRLKSLGLWARAVSFVRRLAGGSFCVAVARLASGSRLNDDNGNNNKNKNKQYR
jgi:hypothetical protein